MPAGDTLALDDQRLARAEPPGAAQVVDAGLGEGGTAGHLRPVVHGVGFDLVLDRGEGHWHHLDRLGEPLHLVPEPRGIDRRWGLRWRLAGILDAVDAAPATWRMLMLPAEGGPPELHRRLARARAVTRAHLHKITGHHDDPDLSIRVLHALADELVRLRLIDPDDHPVDRLLAQSRRIARACLTPAPAHE